MGLFSTKPNKPSSAGCFVFFLYLAVPLFLVFVFSFGIIDLIIVLAENSEVIYGIVCGIVAFFIIMMNIEFKEENDIEDDLPKNRDIENDLPRKRDEKM